MGLNIQEFTRGFVAALVDNDLSSIQPKKSEDLHALRAVYDYLSKHAEDQKKANDRGWYKDLVRLRNEMLPGQTGAFDLFETALRDMQLSFTESPNPSYEHISFTISKPFAKSTLESYGERERNLIQEVALRFLEHRR